MKKVIWSKLYVSEQENLVDFNSPFEKIRFIIPLLSFMILAQHIADALRYVMYG